MLIDGKIVDHEDNAFVAWNPAVIARGPKIGKSGNYFTINGKPSLLYGCQTFWGQTGNVTARSPLGFARDFAQMRSYGFRWTRAFLPVGTEAEKRINDALVQLAQKNGIVIYDTTNLTNTADPDELAKEVASIKATAARYKDVPGMVFDICNEPQFKSDDPALKKLVSDATDTGDWSAPAPTAYWRAMADAQRRWAVANLNGVHESVPARLTSIGWSQGWAGGAAMKDPLEASLDLDFTDRHYYGDLGGFMPDFKDIDLRSLGKPLVLGECGAIDHPGFVALDPWNNGTDDAGYDHRISFLAHVVPGLGGAVMSSWHFRDPMEGIFPCGQTHQDNVPKPTALAYRACALALSRFQPATPSPKVMLLSPDAGRMGGQRDRAISAIHRAATLLIGSRVDYAVLPDSKLANMPSTVKAVFYPLPLDPSDQVIDNLIAFARKGGVVYVSGDLSYDANRQPTKRDRLKQLCGVAWKAGLGTAAADGWPLGDDSTRPALNVDLAGAKAVTTSDGVPSLTRYALGQGKVWFSTVPLEQAIKITDTHRTLYRQVLVDAGLAPLNVTPDSPAICAFHVPGLDADAWLFYNDGPASDVSAGGFTLHLAKGGTGTVIVAHDGAVRVIEAQGAVRRGQKTIANFASNGFLIALDDRDIAASRNLLALPLAPGTISLAVTTKPTSAQVADSVAADWHPLGPVATTYAQGELRIDVAPQQSRDLIRIK
jgi:hypothetical protein